MIAMLLDYPDADDVIPAVRSIGYGASPIPAPVLRAAVERWDCDLSQGYGMTELSGNAVFLGADEHRRAAAGDERLLGAAGYPAPGVELRLERDERRDPRPRAAGDGGVLERAGGHRGRARGRMAPHR